MNRMRHGLWVVTLGTFGALAVPGTVAVAEEVEGRFRLAVQFGAHNPQGEITSDAGNVLTIIDEAGAVLDEFVDPRADNTVFGNLGIDNGSLVTLSAQYAVSRFVLLEASIGQERANVGQIEIHELTVGRLARIDAGELTRVPILLTGIVRFRPETKFNPYAGIGIGYGMIGFDPSPELDELSLNLDQSEGRPGYLGSVFNGSFMYPCPDCGDTRLTGVTVDTTDAFEWHIAGGAEFSFASRWSVFVDLRWIFTDHDFTIEVNGGDPVGVPVPQRAMVGYPALNELPGPTYITFGGLLDLDDDGIVDPGAYYIQDGSMDYSGPSAQIGVRYTF